MPRISPSTYEQRAADVIKRYQDASKRTIERILDEGFGNLVAGKPRERLQFYEEHTLVSDRERLLHPAFLDAYREGMLGLLNDTLLKMYDDAAAAQQQQEMAWQEQALQAQQMAMPPPPQPEPIPLPEQPPQWWPIILGAKTVPGYDSIKVPDFVADHYVNDYRRLVKERTES